MTGIRIETVVVRPDFVRAFRRDGWTVVPLDPMADGTQRWALHQADPPHATLTVTYSPSLLQSDLIGAFGLAYDVIWDALKGTAAP